eukprot:gene6751-7461_t
MSNQDSTIPKRRLGKVSLIGAGPGDPELLTVKAVRRIENASLVISDRLVAPDLLKLVKCELKVANKRPGCAEEAQDELNQWVLEAALQGRDVVRLKIGDPFLFGRGGEEILEYRKHGIEAEVIAGLSSSYAAPLQAMIPLTHRGTANQVLITTGYGQNGTSIDIPAYREDCTLVLLMAVGRLEEIVQSLLSPAKGYPSHLPISIIERATTPKERELRGRLDNILQIAQEKKAEAPAVIVIGHVVDVLR